MPGGFCSKCGTQASGGGGLLAVIGWLFIPFLIPLYPIFGTLSTLAMVGAHYLLSSIGVSDGVRILAIAATGYLSLFVTFNLERAASRIKTYRVLRQVLRVVVLGVIAISALGAGVEDPNSGAAPLFAVIGAPVLYFLARRFDRVYGLAGGPVPKRPGAMDSGFVQQEIDVNRTRFAVTPGRVPNRKLAFLLTTAFVLTVFFGIDAESIILIPPVRLGVIIVGGWLVSRQTKRWTAKTAAAHGGGQFVASVQGIERPDGTLIDRSSIGRLVLKNDADDRTARVANVLWLEPKTGYAVPLAGGMDRSTSERLHAAANRALGFEAVVAS